MVQRIRDYGHTRHTLPKEQIINERMGRADDDRDIVGQLHTGTHGGGKPQNGRGGTIPPLAMETLATVNY